jgi:DNA-binding FrmR family transcriptional regulator
MDAGDMRRVGDLRWRIRTIEGTLRNIDRMVAALDDRFPDERA